MNENTYYYTPAERTILKSEFKELCLGLGDSITSKDIKTLREYIQEGIDGNYYRRDKYGINPTLRNLNTALLLSKQIGPDRSMVVAIFLYNLCRDGNLSIEKVSTSFGNDTVKIINGLVKVSTLYEKQAAVDSDNFRKLLLTFAEDIRVIIIMIVDRLALMRSVNHHPDQKFVHDLSHEAATLYAPLAHRLGLYYLKSELEDLSLKYTDRETYTRIASKLNETKEKRDKYIAEFITPIKEKLESSNLKFEIKGRTKSIYSIWNKMKKQNAEVEDIYDLFAIRIILNAPLEKEKGECWLAYSIVTDMYTANPRRLKDWLTIPKSNGYESLHTTVCGPEKKWVEVQIRTKRMDEIAERGLAAHWKYKGIKSESGLDEWMSNVREMLESPLTDTLGIMRDIKMDIYNKEVFAFTPKGDLFKLPLGATLLDFAFSIHTRIGCQCVGGKVNGKNQKLNYKIQSGDTIEINTQSNQMPNSDWLNIVTTSKAKIKIKQTLNEMANKQAEIGKEILQRRFKNRKIDFDEAILMKLIRKKGFKTVNDFFSELGKERIDINTVIDNYLELDSKENEIATETRTAEGFTLQNATQADIDSFGEDIMFVGNDIKGINYKFAKCCNPIFGDDIFGFISSEGVIKIHKEDCPNATNIKSKYKDRIIKTKWSGKVGNNQYAANLRIIGNDDIGIVTNITSIISKEKNIQLRNISIDSHDGLFQGFLVISVSNISVLTDLIKKIKTIKGVKDVQRSSN